MPILLLQANISPGTMNMIMLGLMLAVMYLFFIRPQAKKQKAQDAFIKSLNKGDDIVTSSGIIGQITKLDETTVTLQISQKGFIEVLRSTISKELTEAAKK
jgi:preprotein translocase subunit YajC